MRDNIALCPRAGRNAYPPQAPPRDLAQAPAAPENDDSARGVVSLTAVLDK